MYKQNTRIFSFNMGEAGRMKKGRMQNEEEKEEKEEPTADLDLASNQERELGEGQTQ
jgi:hypothetical protein